MLHSQDSCQPWRVRLISMMKEKVTQLVREYREDKLGRVRVSLNHQKAQEQSAYTTRL